MFLEKKKKKGDICLSPRLRSGTEKEATQPVRACSKDGGMNWRLSSLGAAGLPEPTDSMMSSGPKYLFGSQLAPSMGQCVSLQFEDCKPLRHLQTQRG